LLATGAAGPRDRGQRHEESRSHGRCSVIVTSLLLVWALGVMFTTTIVPVTPWNVPVPPVTSNSNFGGVFGPPGMVAWAKIIEPPMAT